MKWSFNFFHSFVCWLVLLVGVGLVGVVGVGLDNHRKRCKRHSDVGVLLDCTASVRRASRASVRRASRASVRRASRASIRRASRAARGRAADCPTDPVLGGSPASAWEGGERQTALNCPAREGGTRGVGGRPDPVWWSGWGR